MGEGVTTIFNSATVDTIIDVATKATELFTLEPISYYLVGGIIALALGLFAKAKHII